MEGKPVTLRQPEPVNANPAPPVIYIDETEELVDISRKIGPNKTYLFLGVGGAIVTYLISMPYPEVLSVCMAGIVLCLFIALIGGLRLLALKEPYARAKRLDEEGETIAAAVPKLNPADGEVNGFSFVVEGTRYVVNKYVDRATYQDLFSHHLSAQARYVPKDPTIARISLSGSWFDKEFSAYQQRQDPVVSQAASAVQSGLGAPAAQIAEAASPVQQQAEEDAAEVVLGDAAHDYREVMLAILRGAGLFLVGAGYTLYYFYGGYRSVYLLIISVILGMISGLIYMLHEARYVAHAKRLHDRSEVAPGTIQELYTTNETNDDGNWKRTIYHAQYTFRVSATRYVMNQAIRESLYRVLKVKSTVRVHYVPENPAISRIL